MEKQPFAVLVGAGAIGVLCASPLARLPDICFRVAAGGERLERRRREGLYLNDEKLPLAFISTEEKREADFILIATKSRGYEDALRSIQGFIGRNTVIVPLLNGISAVEIARKFYPETDAVCGFFLGHASVRKGNHIRHDGTGCFYLGRVNEVSAENVERAADLFRKAGIPCSVPENMPEALWKKYILNIGVNQASAKFRSDYGTLQKNPDQLDYAMRLMREAAAVAEKMNIPGASAMPEEAMKVILSMPGEVKTSMLQDVEANQPTEVELFAGTLCQLGRKYGIPTPCNDEVLCLLSEFGGR